MLVCKCAACAFVQLSYEKSDIFDIITIHDEFLYGFYAIYYNYISYESFGEFMELLALIKSQSLPLAVFFLLFIAEL